MKLTGKILLGLAITLATLLSFSTAASSFASAATSNQFVAYSVTVTSSTQTFSATVNETLSPSNTSGFSDLTLQLVSSMSNYSYSKLVNSSLPLLPYLPVTGNESFNYQHNNYSISVSVVKTGTSTVKISGSSYTVTNYSFQLSGSRLGGNSVSVSGDVSALPSGLVYSASVGANGYSASVQLLKTNLPLNTSNSSSSNTKTTSVLIAGGFGTLAAGVGAFAVYRKRNVGEGSEPSQNDEDRKKPLYHVD